MNVDHARNYLNACSILLNPNVPTLHEGARDVMKHLARTLPPAWVAATRTALGL